jgi:hypothetical protein
LQKKQLFQKKMKKTSKVKKTTQPGKSNPASKKMRAMDYKPSSRKRIKPEEEEEEEFIPMDDDLTGLDIFDDEDDDY